MKMASSFRSAFSACSSRKNQIPATAGKPRYACLPAGGLGMTEGEDRNQSRSLTTVRASL